MNPTVLSDTFTERFSPRTVAAYNSNDIMVAKLDGQFHWHRHDNTDDFLLVLKGTLDVEPRNRHPQPRRHFCCALRR